MAYKKAVIDASVAVKWFSDETHTDAAQRILASAFERDRVLYAPDLLWYEIGNALGKGKRMSEEKILAAFGVLFDSPIEFVRLDQTMMHTTIHLMAAYGLTFYDAAYGALAHTLGIPLITANPKDHGKMKEASVVNIEKFLGT
ncbi:MAG: type II toxin-antitoxin system VapC family toxin [Patescibacteria group bacterium]